MAEQWKAIDTMIENAYQEYQELCKQIIAGDSTLIPRICRGLIPEENEYIHIRDYLKNHNVRIDDALRNRIYSYVAKQHPYSSRSDYYGGMHTLHAIREIPLPKELYEYDPEGWIDDKVAIRDEITKHKLLQFEKEGNVTTAEKFVADFAVSTTSGGAMVGQMSKWFKVSMCAMGLTSSWLSMSNRPDETLQEEQNQNEVKYIPEWMFRQMKFEYFTTATLDQLETAQKWAEGNAKIYERHLDLMYSQNKYYVQAGNKTLSMDEVKQRIEEYRLFASKAKEAQSIPESCKQDLPIPIDKLESATKEQLIQAAQYCQEKCDANVDMYNEAIKNGTLSFNEDGKEYSFYEYDVRSRQYMIYAEELQKEAKRRITKNQTTQQNRTYVQSNTAQTQVNASVESPTATPAPTPSQQSGQVFNQSSPNLNGWQGLMSNQFGMSSFSDMKSSLGYVLAMLPDMLVGMFTGKSKNLKFKDNLFPIATIIMGLFMKRNPLLKMMLIGFGGLSLFKKATSEILDNAGVSGREQKQYKQYDDEPLSPRIKNVAMKGNTMLADIDGKPMVLTISETAVDAYYKGKLPLHTLANAVLQKYDEQQAELSLAYEHSVDDSQEQQRSIGIK